MTNLIDLIKNSPLGFCLEFITRTSSYFSEFDEDKPEVFETVSEITEYFQNFIYFSKKYSIPLNCILVDQVGGYEGGGETVNWVFEFTENGTSIGFLQFTGFYGSYTGTEWDETITEVFSRKVEVIQYFPTP